MIGQLIWAKIIVTLFMSQKFQRNILQVINVIVAWFMFGTIDDVKKNVWYYWSNFMWICTKY
jgi:hypothetical protein